MEQNRTKLGPIIPFIHWQGELIHVCVCVVMCVVIVCGDCVWGGGGARGGGGGGGYMRACLCGDVCMCVL